MIINAGYEFSKFCTLNLQFGLKEKKKNNRIKTVLYNTMEFWKHVCSIHNSNVCTLLILRILNSAKI